MSLTRTPLVGVLGGMGPLATVDFLHKLILATPAGRDQEHVPTVVWNVPQIPDRQHYLAGHGDSPLPAMLEGIERLNEAGATRIVIPCNTAHHWFDELAAASTAPLIHIVDATLDALERDAASECVGIIATRGTLQSGLYQQRLAARGISYVLPDEPALDRWFTPGCYAVKRNALPLAGNLLEQVAEALVGQGATRLILACTEVPVALAAINSPLQAVSIDPAVALAKAVLAYWNHAQAAGAVQPTALAAP
ncbi:cysteate racemase [Pseudogulbenkiania subflava]|uniref:Aspartate racemase n=1 Tax=Pseudogulbenkiania subflava DSM 22618 TaxID=1123014 RepID=A0A1Y6CAV6_9NEIS|nr:amino acid racemase [Pseudogulbenkiania subflava]SMF53918.1 aspartate racemase [Pseudogulbenkiania subflava DSM 22618]